ncbi:MAG: hypothetical protein ACPG4Z_05460 [Chitinophagales bacterium]
MRFTLYIMMIFLAFSCKSKEQVSQSETMKNEIVETKNEENSVEALVPMITIVESSTPTTEELRFKISKITTEDNFITVDLSYGGGCIKPHEFSLETTGIINENGMMELTLKHHTHNDLCKMLIMEKRIFNIAPLLDLKSEKLKGYIINSDSEYFYK